jgi:naringenin degradation protein FdeH
MDSGPDRRVPRRVITGHTPDGLSVVLSDGPAPVSQDIAEAGVTLHELWSTSQAEVIVGPINADPAERELTLPPPAGGTKIRIAEFRPGHLDEAGLQSPIHRTSSVDYCIVLQGELVLVLDDVDVALGPGDVVVQRGTDHAWANRGITTAHIAFVMVDADLDPTLQAQLSAPTQSLG